jgi:hypothetical protein
MKISEQGFSERIPTQASRTTAADSGSGTSSIGPSRAGASDNLQLSSLASMLQNASMDTGRSARLNQIAKAVSSNTFQIDPMQISKAVVSEAVQSGAR